MKKIRLLLFLLGFIALAFVSTGVRDAHAIHTPGDVVISCNCNFWGKCRADGDKSACAQNNINCNEENQQCSFGW